MANITLNIEGDLNIYVSEEDGQPDSLYLDGMDGFPETLRIHLEADGEDDESKAEVIYAIPGAAAISMTLYEALTLALNSGGADSLELMPVSGIFIAFNSDDVIIDQNGDCYYPLQTRTLQGFESSCPLLKKDFGKNYCPCPLLKKQLPQKCSSCLLLKKQIKNKYFSCLLFLTTTRTR